MKIMEKNFKKLIQLPVKYFKSMKIKVIPFMKLINDFETNSSELIVRLEKMVLFKMMKNE